MMRLNASIHPSLSETVTENLRRRNVTTTVDFVTTDSVKLAISTGLSYTEILQMKQHIIKEFAYPKRNVHELLTAEKNDVISTGVSCLDELLKGGLCPGYLCELCGSSSSGKTQLCLTIVVNTVATQSDIVWYFDTKKDFSRLRFEEILQAKNFGQEVIKEALQRTKVCYVHSFNELIQNLRQLLSLYKTEQYSLKEKRFLVIIDSLPAIIFGTWQARQKVCELIYQLDELAEVCRFLIFECRAAIVTVNAITHWNSANERNPTDVMPALGKYWVPIPATRLLLTREMQDETRKITVLKDPRVKCKSSCMVTISNAGVTSK